MDNHSHDPATLVTLIVVNEVSIFQLAWLALRRRRVAAVTVDPWLPFLKGPLQKIAARVGGDGRLLHHPELAKIIADYDVLAINYLLTDVFSRTESWINRYFGFQNLDDENFAYALPFRKVTINRLQWHLGLFRFIHEVRGRFPELAFAVRGVDRETAAFYGAFHGQPMGFYFSPMPVPNTLLNALSALMITAMAIFRIAQRFRFRSPSPKSILLGFDATSSRRHKHLLTEIVDDESQIFGVSRNMFEYRRDRDRRWFAPFRMCPPSDGVLGPAAVVSSVFHVLTRGWMLWRRFHGLAPAHFFAVAKFPLIEMMYRALMEKYYFAYFLGRDDYNVEHIFRSWELRRRGGIALGINHGTPYACTVAPVFRYIDFDVYYAFGEDIYRNHYVDKWPPHMRLSVVGAFGLSRQQLAEIHRPCAADIAFFLKPKFDGRGTVEAMFQVARAFPERTVYLKVKNNNLAPFSAEDQTLFAEQKPANVLLTEETADNLILKTRYSISSPSTVVFEAIQFNRVSFCYDTYPEDSSLQFRDYADLCHRSVDTIIERIKDIEAGRWTYPRESFAGLVDLSKRNIFDIIRADIGLPPKAAASKRKTAPTPASQK